MSHCTAERILFQGYLGKPSSLDTGLFDYFDVANGILASIVVVGETLVSTK